MRGITFPGSAKYQQPGPGRVACLRTTNVQDELELADLLYVPEVHIGRPDQIIQHNDIVMSMANSRALVGKVAINRSTQLRCTFGGFLAVIRPTEILPDYLLSVLRVPSVKEQLIESSTQTTNIANISLGRLRPLRIPVPPLSEQARIVSKLNDCLAKCSVLEDALLNKDRAAQLLSDGLLSSLSSFTR